jgi:hypothetical protein
MSPLRVMTATLCGVALLCFAPILSANDDRLKQVIENVRANEALYQKIEAHVTESYRLPEPDPQAPPFYFTGQIKSSTSNMRTVVQDQFLYFRYEQPMELVDGTHLLHNAILGYDGQYTRRLEDKTGNLVHGPVSHPRRFRPHAWMLGNARVAFPLSVWLTGGKELQNQQGAGLYQDYCIQKVFYEKEEMTEGLHTVKLRAQQNLMDQPTFVISFTNIWLATDRNYLPVKTEGFQPVKSNTLPVEVGRVSDFREIAPGVWLPFQQSIVVYDTEKLPENKLVVENTKEATLTHVDLNPHYDISLFRDIPIPDGTLVYEVKDDKIINSYKQGEETNPHWTPSRSWLWLWVLAGGLVLLSFAGWAAYRWRRRAHPAAA